MSLFGCDSIIGRACNDCPETENNKIIHLALVKKGTAQWTSQVRLRSYQIFLLPKQHAMHL
jgi:hypothetical protein